MNIYLRTILSVPALLVFVVMWILGAVTGWIGSGMVLYSAEVGRQTERLLDWINPARRAYEHKPLRQWIEEEAKGQRIGLTDFPEVDKEAFIEAIDALEDEDSGWPGGWL